MTALIAVTSFYAGMIFWHFVLKGLRRLKGQSIALHTPAGWREIELVPPEDIVEAELRWQEAIGVREN